MKKFFLLLTLVLLSNVISLAQTPYVIWCSDNTTLYFTYSSGKLSVNGSFIPEGESESHTITALWSGTQVTESPETPGWYSYKPTTAVIESSFIEVKPKSLSRWFCSSIYSGGVSNLTTIEGFTNLNSEDATTMSDLFCGCYKLENLDFSNFNTSNVTNMGGMFNRCSNLTSLDLSSFNTSNVTNMGGMFCGCSKLTSLDLSSFNTSNVTHMQSMFEECSNLTSLDLSSFNTSNVTNMQYMFEVCSKLTSLDLSSFNTSNVTNMLSMFSLCSNLTSFDLSSFNTSNVTNMEAMFNYCSNLTNLDLSSFNTSNVTNMQYMFCRCGGLTTLNLSNFNTSMVSNMNYMFYYCGNLHTIIVSDLWSLNNVSTGNNMFSGCTSLVGGSGTVFDNTEVTQEYAHIDAHELGYPGYFTASNTTSILQPDLRAHKIETDKQTIIPGESLQISWNTANLGEQSTTGGWSEQVSLVSETGEILKDLALLDFDEILSGESFVSHQVEVSLPFLLGIDGKVRIQVKIIPNESTGEPEEAQENNTQVSNLVYTINKILRLEINPSRVTEGITNEVQATLSRSATWNQSHTFNLSYSKDSRIQNLYSVNIPAGQSSVSFSIGISDNNVFDTDSIVSIKATLSGYTAAQAQFILVDDELSNPDGIQTPYVVWCSENSTLYFTNRSNPLYINGTFTPEGETTAIVITNLWSAEQVTSSSSTPDWNNVFSSCKQVVFESGFQNVRPTRTSKWFYSGKKIEAISGLNYLNTEEVTAMNEMFYHCDLVTSLDVSHFNTEKVTNMLSMFDNCYSVQSLDVSHFNTSKCTTMQHMFQGCNTLTEIDLSNFDTRNVTTMFCMFNDSYSLTHINLGNFNTSSVTNMALMFNGCSSLPDVDLSSFDTSKVKDMHNMFNGCSSLTSLDLSNFNTSNVTNMSYMFNGCNSLTSLDLSNFNTSNVTNMSYMFNGCSQINKIIVSDLWSVKRVTSGNYMFNNCTSLEGGKGTTFDNSQITHNYAHIDEVGNPGYFTASNDTVCIQPDLTVRKINVDKQTITPGEHITVTWVTANFGKQATTGGWSERVSLVAESGGAIKEIAKLDFEETLAGESFVNHQAEIDLPFLLGIEGKVKAMVEIIPNELTGESEDMQANNIQSSDIVFTVNNLLKLEITPSRVLENSVTEVQATLSRSGTWNVGHYIYLHFSEDSRIQNLSGVTIPSGQSSVSFSISIIDNNVFDTDSIVTVEARRSGYTSSQAQLIIVDDEMPKLNVTTSKSELSEGETFELTVTADHAPTTETSLMLTCDNSARFDFPSQLTLPAGETSVSTTITVIDDHDIAETLSAAFTVSANGYESGEAIVIVNDDDMPHIEMVLFPTKVVANAGANAIMGTIRRTDNVNSKVTVVLSDDAEGLLTYSSQQIILESGVSEAHFTISRNSAVTADCEVNVTAAVYIKTCNCPAAVQSGGSTTQQLTLLAEDGPTLIIEPLTTDLPSDSNQGGFVVKLESPAQQAIEVYVSSDHDDALEYEHIVTIPAGETSVSVPVARKGEAEIPEGQVIVFTASADGYSSSACWTIATENSMPDAVITSFAVSAAEAEAGSEAELTIVVKNAGSGQLGENTSIKVTLSDGSYPIVLKTGTTLSSGESMTITTSYQLPLSIGDYVFQATINPAGKVDEVVTANNISQEIPISITPNYHLTALVDKTSYGQGELITVTGKATGSGSAFADVEVYFINDDMRQTITAKTDAEGNYSALFLPIDGTSGHFVIGACFPGEDKTDAMTEVDVYGLKLQNYRTTCQLGQGGSFNGVITVTNPGQEPQTILQVVPQDTPIGCEFSFTDLDVIEAGQTLEIPYTITAVGNEGTTGVKRMNVSVKTNEGALVEYTIDYSVEPIRGSLKADSTSIAMNMTLGVAREFPLTIWNEGLAPSGAISLTLPDWIQSVTPQQMPSLASGDSVTVILRIVPNDKMYLNIPNSGRIGMNCADGTGLSIPIKVTPVSDQNGTFTIDVLDEFAFCTEEKPHVSGATVQVINRATQAVVAEGVTNAEGKFTADIPEGWYRLKVSANHHEAYDEYLLVDPGTNKTKTVFLSFNGITWKWEVEETEVEDEYTMETVVKYESQVPPPYIKVIWPKEKPQVGKYYPVTLVNKGLIKFYDVKANLSISSSKYNLDIIGNPEIDTLEAGQAAVLYAKLSLKNNPNLSRSVRRMVEDNTDPQEPSEDQETISDECAELIANIEGLYFCGEPVDKEFIERLRLGNCKNNKPHSGGSGNGGGSKYAPEEPEEIACDLPKFKIVAADDNVYSSRRSFWDKGHVEKGGVTMRGVATDGISKVKIVLDDYYDVSKISRVVWEIDEKTYHGKLYYNPNELEGAEYEAPDYFPEDKGTTYKVKINLYFTIDGIEKTIKNAVEVELIRVPVMMVQDCESEGKDFWKSCKGKLSSIWGPLYKYFQFYTQRFPKSWAYDRAWYQKSLGEQMNERARNFLQRIEENNKYVASKIDYLGHGMAGLIKMDPLLIHKYITLNTPHGGSQWANFMDSQYSKFVMAIEDNKKKGIIAPYPKERNSFRHFYGSYMPGFLSGAYIDGNNDRIMKNVRCHAISTTKGTSSLSFFNYNSPIDYRIFGFAIDENDEYMSFQEANDVMFDESNDWWVPESSQRGGLEYPKSYNIDNCGHLESGSNSEVLEHISKLLTAKDNTMFSYGGFHKITPSLNYYMDNIMEIEFFTFKFYNSENCSNWHNLLESYFPDKIESSSRTVKKGMEEGGLKDSLNNDSIYLSYQYNVGDTLMNIRIETLGLFNYLSFDGVYNNEVFANVNSQEGTIKLPEKIKGDIIVRYEGKNNDGYWFYETDTIAVNTIGNATMQKLSFDQDSLLIINDEYLSPKVLCTWSDGTVTEVENPTLSVTNGNLAYIEDNKYVYGKNKGHTNLVARYGNLSCSTPLEVYITGEDDEMESGNDSGDNEKSVCSSVTLSIRQRSVMTRQAFRGTLTINNNHPSLPLENLKLHVEVRDEDGTLATQHEFQINPESLNGDFTGELDFDSGWELKSGGTGVATVLFIPTRNAAPTEPKQWSFGGTISYTDPFTGLVVTHKLKPVTLTVNPTPILDFTYFMQRDVMGDDPMTENTTEECVPAEFALLINNKGNADAKNLKFVCKQPQIIENEKGLLVDFSIARAQLNGEDKVLTLSNDIPMEVGTIAAQSQAYMQWWLKSSLMGHFNEYDVTFNHKTSYGNEELSLIDQVSIHELIHGFTPPSALSAQSSTMSRAFLVNDTEDSNDTPDRIYFTNTTQEEATVATEATITRQSGTDYLLSVTPSQQGWTYVLLDNPLSDKATVVRITRQSDGAELPVDNLWLTDRTLRDGEVAQVDKKLHFIGEVPEGGEQYLVVFDFKPDRQLKVDTYEGVPAKNVAVDKALTEVTVCFNKPITEETFTIDDLTLFHEGTLVDLSTVSISKVDDQTFTLNLGTTTSQDGYYVLLVNTQDIDDSDGFEGTVSKEASWMQDTSTSDNVILGDVNGDGQVDLDDAKSIMNYLIGYGQSYFMMKVADTNKNGQIDIGDAVTIVNSLKGKLILD